MAIQPEEALTYSQYLKDRKENPYKYKGKSKKPVPLLDEITMGPIKKYIKYNIFPWRLLFHIFLLIVTLAQILLIINNIAIYMRSQEKVWRNTFGEEVLDTNDVEFIGIRNIYTLNDIQDHIKESVQAYFDFDTQYYTHITTTDPETGEEVPIPVSFESFYLRGDDRDRYLNLSTKFTENYIGIWEKGDAEIIEFLNRTTHFSLTYEVEHNLPNEISFIHDCFKWVIVQDFDFFYRNHLVQRFSFDAYP